MYPVAIWMSVIRGYLRVILNTVPWRALKCLILTNKDWEESLKRMPRVYVVLSCVCCSIMKHCNNACLGIMWTLYSSGMCMPTKQPYVDLYQMVLAMASQTSTQPQPFPMEPSSSTGVPRCCSTAPAGPIPPSVCPGGFRVWRPETTPWQRAVGPGWTSG